MFQQITPLTGIITMVTLPMCTYFLKGIADDFKALRKEVAEHHAEIEVIKTEIKNLKIV